VSLSPIAEAGIIVGIVIVGMAIEGFSDVQQTRDSLTSRQRMIIAALAIGVAWYALFFELFPSMPISETIVAVAIAVALWIGLPFLFARAYGIDVVEQDHGLRVGAHYRPTSDATEPGVYRVVGISDEVVLLRLTDDEDRRIHTGEIIRVPEDVLESSFDPAPNPDD
jgi:hypothetical protein